MGDARAHLLAKGVFELAQAEAGDGGEFLVGEGVCEVGFHMTLHLGDTRGYAGSDGGAHAASLGQQPEPHLIHAGHVAPLGHHAVQEGEVVALGLIQLDEGVVPQGCRQPVALLHQKHVRRVGGVVVAKARGDDAGKTGGEATSPALHLDLEGADEGDHQLGVVMTVALHVALVVTQAEGGGGR